MDMDFAFWRTLVHPGLPIIRFLFVRSRLCTTLPSDHPSRDAPLRVASTSPPSGCAGDFHPLVIERARHTPDGRLDARKCELILARTLSYTPT